MSYIFEKDLIKLDLEATNWEDAIVKTCRILEDKGYINNNFCNRLIEVTKEIGPYYIITKNICIPHLRPEEGVLKEGFSLFKFNKKVDFLGNEIEYLIYILSLSDENHLEKISKVADILENKEFFSKISSEGIDNMNILNYINN